MELQHLPGRFVEKFFLYKGQIALLTNPIIDLKFNKFFYKTNRVNY
jgi:hypothetical protein